MKEQLEKRYEETLPLWKHPERVVMAVCRKPGGGANVITLAWKMRTSFRPPMVAISVGLTRYSHELIESEREFVLAVPGKGMAEAALFCGTRTGRGIDKFAGAGLTPLPARVVKAPLIAEAAVNLEFRVSGSLLTGDHTVFAAEVVNSWVSARPEPVLLSISDDPRFAALARGKSHLLGTIHP